MGAGCVASVSAEAMFTGVAINGRRAARIRFAITMCVRAVRRMCRAGVTDVSPFCVYVCLGVYTGYNSGLM